MECYYIFDDWCDSLNREGFCIFFGDPHSAIGTRQSEQSTLSAARYWLLHHVAQGEEVYRVWLARRHGEHRVAKLSL